MKKIPAARKFPFPPPPHNFSNGPSLMSLKKRQQQQQRALFARPYKHIQYCKSYV